MATLNELMAQRESLDQQIRELRAQEHQTAVDKVKAIIAEFGLTAADVFSRRATAGEGRKVAIKYRDPATGATWTGRGREPKWIEGKDRAAYLVA